MKKLLSILLVAMFTMAFVQAASMPISSFTITNKTTGKVETVKVSQFSGVTDGIINLESSCLGIYEGDQIEITYTPAVGFLTSQLTWSYSWEGDLSSDFGTGKTVELTVPKPSFDGKNLIVTCNYQEDGPAGSTPTSKVYKFRFENVHNGKRFDVGVDSWNNLFRVTYNHYDEVQTCLTKAPYVTVTNSLSGVTVFSGSMNGNGEITFNTAGKNGTVIVNVTVDGVALPALKTYIW